MGTLVCLTLSFVCLLCVKTDKNFNLNIQCWNTSLQTLAFWALWVEANFFISSQPELCCSGSLVSTKGQKLCLGFHFPLQSIVQGDCWLLTSSCCSVDLGFSSMQSSQSSCCLADPHPIQRAFLITPLLTVQLGGEIRDRLANPGEGGENRRGTAEVLVIKHWPVTLSSTQKTNRENEAKDETSATFIELEEFVSPKCKRKAFEMQAKLEFTKLAWLLQTPVLTSVVRPFFSLGTASRREDYIFSKRTLPPLLSALNTTLNSLEASARFWRKLQLFPEAVSTKVSGMMCNDKQPHKIQSPCLNKGKCGTTSRQKPHSHRRMVLVPCTQLNLYLEGPEVHLLGCALDRLVSQHVLMSANTASVQCCTASLDMVPSPHI